MQLAPGPLPQLDTSWYPVTYDPPNFSDMVNTAMAEADAVSAEMDALVDPFAIFDDVLTGDTIMTDLETVDQINGDNAHLANLSGIPVGDKYKANGDAFLIAAGQSIPGEVFSTVPATTAYGTVTQAGPTARIAGVALANLSGGDPQSYYVGDQYQLVVRMDTTTGQELDFFNVNVYAVVTKDGIPQPNIEIGHTGSDGAVTSTGQWQNSDQGAWTMYVHADPQTGGDIVSQLYQWTVSVFGKQPAGATQPIVTVQLTNQTSGSLSNNHVNDVWLLTVTGPPNSPVYVTGAQNGAALSESQLGSTDANGNFQLYGQWYSDNTGQWVENYAVGRYPWAGTLQFTVSP